MLTKTLYRLYANLSSGERKAVVWDKATYYGFFTSKELLHAQRYIIDDLRFKFDDDGLYLTKEKASLIKYK